MYSPTFVLLQNEGFLIQGCLKSALATLLKSSSSERGPLYAGLFNYSIGLERLLKLTLLLDHCIEKAGQFPTHAQIKKFGHDLVTLHAAAEAVVKRHAIEIPEACRADDIDRRFIELLSGFAVAGRYFNLDALTGGGKSVDPLPEWGKLLMEVYERDVPPLKRASEEEQVEALAEDLKPHTTYIPGTSFGGEALDYEAFYQDHGKSTLTMPEVVWRFARMLYPFQMLVFEMNEALISGQAGDPRNYPHMWEFCAFCGEDKLGTLDEIEGY